MKAILVFVIAAVAVPSVLTISCYKCEPDVTKQTFCDKPTTVVDCDDEPDLGMGKYDACLQATFTIGYLGATMKGGTMMCMVQTVCDTQKSQGCDTLEQTFNGTGIQLKECDVECCQDDKCNDRTSTTTAAPTGTGASHGASFVIVVSLFGLFYSIFVR